MDPANVKDIVSNRFAIVHENDTLSKCLSLFRKETLPALIVTDNRGRYKSSIAERWVIRSQLDPATTKVKKLMRQSPTVTLRDSLSNAARLMIESKIMQLPVLDGEKIVGIVTDEGVIHGAVSKNWGATKIEEIMTKNPFVIEEEESVNAVLSLFREHGISHAPVVNDGALVGIVSIHDVIEDVFKPKERQTRGDISGRKAPMLSIPVRSMMTKPAITVVPETTLRDAESKMHEYKISSLIVVRKDRPVGIVTKLDFLEPIAQMEKAEEKLTVQFSIKDVAIDETQQGFMMTEFESFMRRFKKALVAGTLFVYIKAHGRNYKGNTVVHCRLQLRTVKGSFFSVSEGWGIEQTFRMALDRLERQILKSREFEHSPEFARKYLRRIRFPLTEL